MQEQKTETKNEERIVRLMSEDIGGNMKIYVGLTKIKGISWSFANAVLKILKIDKNKRVGSLSDQEIKRISDFVKDPKLPSYIVNRRIDLETGEDKHLTGSNLELKNEFDVKRLRKIKSYKGYRHALKLPVRGQRTRGNFRRNRAKGVGIKKKNKQ
jgi:small subunit ribosomal protein S13